MRTDARFWDDRYASQDLVWSAGPNAEFASIAAELTPGTALDLGAGEARNALWLAENGWQAVAVDFSSVAMDRAAQLAQVRLGAQADRLQTVVADIVNYQPESTYDLVLIAYIHLVADERWRLFHAAASAVRPGGRLVVIAHDSANLTEGVGGPQDPAVLYSAGDVLECLEAEGLEVLRAERMERTVMVDRQERTALDLVVVLRRPE